MSKRKPASIDEGAKRYKMARTKTPGTGRKTSKGRDASALKSASASSQSLLRKKGDHVAVKFTDTFHTGVITKVRRNGTYDVVFEDGDSQIAVREDEIKKKTSVGGEHSHVGKRNGKIGGEGHVFPA